MCGERFPCSETRVGRCDEADAERPWKEEEVLDVDGRVVREGANAIVLGVLPLYPSAPALFHACSLACVPAGVVALSPSKARFKVQ